eukprot:TRINITY_DN50787_c0_g1_i1.p1 TRINITY_DN50787_c0_g1~~TRINITY_DN50787_c0_g1_i1.p1  ORF type:complete len:655 (+),score=56.15 TRINITY_DN50787_c0_g1_i1:150-2114(+)
MTGTYAWPLFCRAVALCMLICQLSLYHQLPGLIGPNGVHPAAVALRAIDVAAEAAAMPTWAKILRFPTLMWLAPDAETHVLQGLCLCGIAAATLAVVGLGTRVPLLLSLAIWISFIHISGEFMCYPWDWLLAEAVALAVLLPQPAIWLTMRKYEQPSSLVTSSIRFLGFRLMFGMGLKKFYDVGQDSPWRSGSYLPAFYSWQPMPTPGGWLAAQSGEVFTNVQGHIVWFTQVVLPFAVFGPRKLRWVASLVLLGEQAWIQFVGNYGIFNMVSAVLFTFPLLHDLPLLQCRSNCQEDEKTGNSSAPPSFPHAIVKEICSFVASVNMAGGAFFLARNLLGGDPTFTWLSSPLWMYKADGDEAALGAMLRYVKTFDMPRCADAVQWLSTSLLSMLRFVAPFRFCNQYGIFRTAPELDVGVKPVLAFQGLQADKTWEDYIFKSSRAQATGGFPRRRADRNMSGNVNYLPPWFAPHQPRLDHSAFYYGLELSIGSVGFDNTYTLSLNEGKNSQLLMLCALAAGKPEVLALMGKVPPQPPTGVRAAELSCEMRPWNSSASMWEQLVLAHSESPWVRCKLEDSKAFKISAIEKAAKQQRQSAQQKFNQQLTAEWQNIGLSPNTAIVPGLCLSIRVLWVLARRRCSRWRTLRSDDAMQKKLQ